VGSYAPRCGPYLNRRDLSGLYRPTRYRDVVLTSLRERELFHQNPLEPVGKSFGNSFRNGRGGQIGFVPGVRLR